MTTTAKTALLLTATDSELSARMRALLTDKTKQGRADFRALAAELRRREQSYATR